MSLTFIDFFAGVGGFRRGMELAGHKCLGHCEKDNSANMSYEEIHKPLEGEWHGTDIKKVRAEELPRADVWCAGFPCQDISVSGNRTGFKGNRSSLFFEFTRLIRETKEEDRPKYLFIENVKNLLNINKGYDFAKLLIELDEVGYDAEWQVVNSNQFGVPQNRERVFIIGHLRSRAGCKVFPVKGSCRTTKGKHEINLADFRYDEGLRVRKNGESPCLTSRLQGVKNKGLSNTIYVVDLRNNEFKIRKLTPREAWKLQAWKDEDFEKASKVCTDSQLYKQAGNGVTVSVIHEMGKKLK